MIETRPLDRRAARSYLWRTCRCNRGANRLAYGSPFLKILPPCKRIRCFSTVIVLRDSIRRVRHGTRNDNRELGRGRGSRTMKSRVGFYRSVLVEAVRYFSPRGYFNREMVETKR